MKGGSYLPRLVGFFRYHPRPFDIDSVERMGWLIWYVIQRRDILHLAYLAPANVSNLDRPAFRYVRPNSLVPMRCGGSLITAPECFSDGREHISRLFEHLSFGMSGRVTLAS